MQPAFGDEREMRPVFGDEQEMQPVFGDERVGELRKRTKRDEQHNERDKKRDGPGGAASRTQAIPASKHLLQEAELGSSVGGAQRCLRFRQWSQARLTAGRRLGTMTAVKC